MRKALNENPVVQIAVLGLVGVAFAILLFTTFLSGGNSTAPAPAGLAPDGSGVVQPTSPEPVTPVASSAAPIPAVPSIPDAPQPANGAQDKGGLAATKGLPKGVVAAYEADKAIALLVIDPKAEISTKLESYTRRLGRRNGVAVFVVKTRRIAEYSRITVGVAVSQAPALVVVRPRKLTGGVPTATVTYGFRSPQSVAQAVDDALYKGKPVPSYP